MKWFIFLYWVMLWENSGLRDILTVLNWFVAFLSCWWGGDFFFDLGIWFIFFGSYFMISFGIWFVWVRCFVFGRCLFRIRGCRGRRLWCRIRGLVGSLAVVVLIVILIFLVIIVAVLTTIGRDRLVLLRYDVCFVLEFVDFAASLLFSIVLCK